MYVVEFLAQSNPEIWIEFTGFDRSSGTIPVPTWEIYLDTVYFAFLEDANNLINKLTNGVYDYSYDDLRIRKISD